MKIQKNIVDPKHYNKPIKSYFSEEAFYLENDIDYISNIKYHYSKLDTDAGVILEQINTLHFVEFSTLDIRNNGKGGIDSNFLSIYLYLNKDSKHYSRSYLKIPDLIANVGGFMGI